MKKLKKIIAMCLATTMALSIMCVNAFAKEPVSGITNNNGILLAEGQEAIDYLVEKGELREANNSGSPSIMPRGVNIPTSTFRLSDRNTHSSYYSITTFIYSSYCFYPHDIDGDIQIIFDPENSHTVRVQACKKGTTTPVFDYPIRLTAGTRTQLRLDESCFSPNDSYYIKFISEGNGGAWVTSDYTVL